MSESALPSIPARCHFCKKEITLAADHDTSKHPAHEQVSTQYQKPSRRNMIVANYLRVSDELVEYTSAFVQEDGNVVISAAWFKTLMGEAGWKARNA